MDMFGAFDDDDGLIPVDRDYETGTHFAELGGIGDLTLVGGVHMS